MVTTKKKTKAQVEAESIKRLASTNESYLVGLLWNQPLEAYTSYSEKISSDDFLHPEWGFYFELGKRLYKKGIKKFDDISVNATVEEIGVRDTFDKYGGYGTMVQLIDIVRENAQNIESYYDALLKNKVIMALIDLIGGKVITNNKKYDYREMNAREISQYWQNKMNNIAIDGISSFESENLYISGKEFLKNLENKADGVLRFANSRLLNGVVQGMPRGEVTMLGGFGNSGKSSFMTDKVLLSCIYDVDKTLVILNEEGADKLREKIFLSLVNHEMNKFGDDNQRNFKRKRLNKVNELNDEDRTLIYETFEKLKDLMDGDEAHIKIVFMEQYQIEDLKNIIALHANLGYVNLIIDTHKVPDNYKSASRWEAIVEATKEIYKLTRPESGGFNLRTMLTIQLADNHIKDKFLGYDAIGEGKGMKNEASILMMYRPIFDDEYDKIKPYRFVKNGMNGDGFIREEISLERDRTYYVMFIPKNRYGQNTDNGQDAIIYEARFLYNSFVEVGFANIPREYN